MQVPGIHFSNSLQELPDTERIVASAGLAPTGRHSKPDKGYVLPCQSFPYGDGTFTIAVSPYRAQWFKSDWLGIDRGSKDQNSSKPNHLPYPPGNWGTHREHEIRGLRSTFYHSLIPLPFLEC